MSNIGEGDRVVHRTFGSGVVVYVTGMGAVATVQFDNKRIGTGLVYVSNLTLTKEN